MHDDLVMQEMEPGEIRAFLAAPIRYAIQDRRFCGWSYTLTHDIIFPIPAHLSGGLRSFKNEWMSIERQGYRWFLVLRKDYSSDGCTAAPDFALFATLKKCRALLDECRLDEALRLAGTYVAHWPHDAVYQFASEIKRAWDCPVGEVIDWANQFFNWIMQQCGTPASIRLAYYRAVCLLGSKFARVTRWWRKVFGVSAALVALLVGCQSTPAPAPALPSFTDSELTEFATIRRAVCIGWNSVDPAKWAGWSGPLPDCEFDAELWYETFRDYGFEATNLLTEAATIDNCYAALKWAVRGMGPGSLLVVTISGHAGQGPDTYGEGRDGLGEYVCAYDGPVSDNVINEWLLLVPGGVHILWIPDTCHSGTLYKARPRRINQRAIPADFSAELILLAGCSEDGYSLSTGNGGMWSVALEATGPAGQSPRSWFRAAALRVPPEMQVPVYAEYGAVSEAFREGIIVP